jgi:hypothetical protein
MQGRREDTMRGVRVAADRRAGGCASVQVAVGKRAGERASVRVAVRAGVFDSDSAAIRKAREW